MRAINFPQIVRRIKKDIRTFGPNILKVDAGRWMGSAEVTAKLRDIGVISLRPLDSDLDTFRQVYQQRQYKVAMPDQRERLHRYYEQLLELGVVPVIIDAGANVGAAALWFSTTYPRARIVAIEPDAASAAHCRFNTVSRSNVTVVEGAIGGTPGRVAVVKSEKSWAIITERTDARAGLKVVTVRELADQAGKPSALFIVKVDIEGFEADLFETGTEWISETAAVYIEVHDWLFPNKRTSQSMQKAMWGQGFEILLQGENMMFIREAGELANMLTARQKEQQSGGKAGESVGQR